MIVAMIVGLGVFITGLLGRKDKKRIKPILIFMFLVFLAIFIFLQFFS